MDKIQKRFKDLTAQAERLKCDFGFSMRRVLHVGDPEEGPEMRLREWRSSCLTLIGSVFDESHSTYQDFYSASMDNITPRDAAVQLLPIFDAAKSDFEGGFPLALRNLVHAEVFADELEQAEHLLNANWKVPAAVVAGVVLETTLRKLCENNDDLEAAENINKMNDGLVKATVYNKMRHKQVTVWANIRNDAAHGHPDEFDNSDVSRMIDGIRDFVAAQLS